MTKVIKFKKECIGFVDTNYRDFTKPSYCAHYCLDGKCAFFYNCNNEHIDCDDKEAD